MLNKIVRHKRITIIKIGSILLVTSLVLLGFSLFNQAKISTQKQEPKITQAPKVENPQWDTLTNSRWGYEISYPRLLLKKEAENTGDFLDFVVLQENEFAKGYGVAIGVAAHPYQEEVDRIRKQFESEDLGNLINESEGSLRGEKYTRLDYEPKDPKTAQPKSVVIIHHKEYTYSISTAPEQIDAVISSLMFTE